MEKLIRELPKVELHLHLDGSLRIGTVIELAQKAGVELPTQDPEKLKEYLEVNEGCSNLEEYLEKFVLPLKVMQSKEALKRIAYELAEDVAQENVKYLELRFAPLLLVEELEKEEVVEAVLAGLKEAEDKYDLQANIILCCMRHQDPSKSVEVAQLAIDYMQKGVVGLDLAGDEANFPPEEHEKAFQLAKGAGLHRTVHAGEASGAASVRKAIDFLSAERIGHGVRTQENKETLEIVQEKKIPLEMCPSSNLHTNVVTELAEHSIKEYYDLGIPVTLNTDNRRVSNLTLSGEYMLLYEEVGFELADIKEIVLNGVRAAFISDKEKQILLKKFEKEFDVIEQNSSN
jgi:adenosine deaminase